MDTFIRILGIVGMVAVIIAMLAYPILTWRLTKDMVRYVIDHGESQRVKYKLSYKNNKTGTKFVKTVWRPVDIAWFDKVFETRDYITLAQYVKSADIACKYYKKQNQKDLKELLDLYVEVKSDDKYIENTMEDLIREWGCDIA